MNSQMRELMQKRSVLLARIAAQREQMSTETAHLRLPFAVADHGLAAARYLRAHPLILAGVAGVAGVVAFLAVRRNGVIGLARNAMRLWNLYNSARNFAGKSVSRP